MELVFVCTYNSGRSQMAEAFARGEESQWLKVSSAGITPGKEVNPKTQTVMRELGFDLNGQRPKELTLSKIKDSSYVVVMGRDVDLETSSGIYRPQEIWDVPNPKGKPVEVIREIRDYIRARVDELLDRISCKNKNAA